MTYGEAVDIISKYLLCESKDCDLTCDKCELHVPMKEVNEAVSISVGAMVRIELVKTLLEKEQRRLDTRYHRGRISAFREVLGIGE